MIINSFKNPTLDSHLQYKHCIQQVIKAQFSPVNQDFFDFFLMDYKMGGDGPLFRNLKRCGRKRRQNYISSASRRIKRIVDYILSIKQL